MKKIDVAQVITILANIGVIAGIVFLGLELRQNNQLLRMEAINSVLETRMYRNETTLLNQDLAEIVVKARNREQLTDAELERISAGNERINQGYRRDYLLYKAGILPKGLMEEHLPRMRRSFQFDSQGSAREVWNSGWYEYAGDGFRRFVEECLIEVCEDIDL